MAADAFDQLAFFVLDAFSGFRHANIPVPQVGHGTDDQLRCSVFSGKHKHLAFKVFRCIADHMDIECSEQLFRRIEKRG